MRVAAQQLVENDVHAVVAPASYRLRRLDVVQHEVLGEVVVRDLPRLPGQIFRAREQPLLAAQRRGEAKQRRAHGVGLGREPVERRFEEHVTIRNTPEIEVGGSEVHQCRGAFVRRRRVRHAEVNGFRLA